MKFIKYAAVILSLCSLNANAGQIELPHTFSSGTKAVAAEVNENFSTLVVESNSQDSRISLAESSLTEAIKESNSQDLRINALEAVTLTTVTDQLICVVHYTWPIDGSSYDCAQQSAPSDIRSLTYSQVAQEGWTATSVGGDGSSNRMIYVFSK
ncbi:hypothetical protein ACJJIW_08780 [Microbulbifer sp. JMSA004]|uniref:hypothetical protein n=1 Tax=unclassified Microbulbifer TaxID=2619833 RepID=UPI0024ADEB39|nr:hypothetical protein [Microbulbifer sp. VAAF005]WHI45364.1 hypothetical protein P0078_16735 [Microbulbifer sp. VAAF005]